MTILVPIYAEFDRGAKLLALQGMDSIEFYAPSWQTEKRQKRDCKKGKTHDRAPVLRLPVVEPLDFG
jgi:hypothetical protein